MFAKNIEHFTISRFIIISSAINFLISADGKHISNDENQETCGLTDSNGINTFILETSASPVGPIPLIHIQFDTKRQMAVTSTVVYNEMNQIKNASRGDRFREIGCGNLHGKQQKCSRTMKMTDAQKQKIDSAYTSWDRGHLTPVSPMKFSDDAQDVTFYCVNIAPQEPWSNRCSYYMAEERTLTFSKTAPSFVITGVCSRDNLVDGETFYKQAVPECFWKMICYLDPRNNHKTRVVAFVSNNSLIPAETVEEERKYRWKDTAIPRSQNDILKLLDSKAELISKAWEVAEETLTKGRETSHWPKAAQCTRSKRLIKSVRKEWEMYMREHRAKGVCKHSFSLTSTKTY